MTERKRLNLCLTVARLWHQGEGKTSAAVVATVGAADERTLNQKRAIKC